MLSAEPLTASVHIAAGPERVFEYFVRPEAIVRWMGDHAVLDPRPNGEFTVDINGVPVRGRYLEVEPPHRLLISWGHAGSYRLPPGASTVEVTLTPEGDGTTVRIVHRDLPAVEAQQHALGWQHFLERLVVVGAGGDPGPDPWATASRKLVLANGVDLCVETFGDPLAPAILLIGGSESSMDWWDEEFCERLASGQTFVIRYDLRDTGQSVSYEPGAPQYTGSDLVADAVGLLDSLTIERAHLVGISMGGGIAQHVALVHPERVASLTLISTSPAVDGPAERDLPPASDELKALFADPPPPPDWSDRAAVIDYIVASQRPFEGSLASDEEELRSLVGRVVDRTSNVESTLTNHSLLEEGEPVHGALDDINAPTLVLHGTEDPLFPFAHGEALAAEIPGARLLALEGMGHQIPPRPLWDVVVAAILEHTGRAGL